MLLFCHLGHSHREKWMGGWLDGERERRRGRLTNWTVLRMCGNKVSDNREYTTSVSLRLLVSGFLGGSVVKNACNAGDPRSIPESGRTPEEGNGYPLQYSCLEKPMDRGAWWATVHRVTESLTWLSSWAHMHTEDNCFSFQLARVILAAMFSFDFLFGVGFPNLYKIWNSGSHISNLPSP